MDGIAFLRAAHERNLTGGAKIVLLSSGYFPPIADCSIDRSIMKPVLRDDLLALLADLFHVVSSATKAEIEVPRGSSSKGLRILVAEDNPVNQKLAQRMLERSGYTVTVVSNGLEAISAFEQGEFALILMDGQMPEMDGLDAAKAIRRLELITGGHVPIIALTAQALNGDRERFLAAGMDDYISKPIQQRELFDSIERALSRTITESTK
ncbi:MAG TPA: response regulator, partial [Bryobacteraceae bacterium]